MRIVLMTAALLLPSILVSAADVEVVTGGLMEAEGGSWTPDQSPLISPFGVAFDSAETMWIVELEGGRVHRLTADGTLSLAGGATESAYTGDGGPLRQARFNGMHNCAVLPNDDLLIADSWNHVIRRVNAGNGVISTLAGTGSAGFSGDGGAATRAEFDFVMCITLTPKADRVHVADLKNLRIREVNLGTGLVRTVAGNGERGVPADGAVATAAPLIDPRAAAEDEQGILYILERGGHALRAVLPDGTIRTVAGTGKRGFADGPAAESEFGSPKHLCIGPQGKVYIADDQNGAIRVYDPAEKSVRTVLGRSFGDPAIRLKNPHGVTWHKGWLYVVDMGNNRILRVRG
jgi:sugar lactone lactonase YvrE